MAENPENPVIQPESSIEAAGGSTGEWDDLQIGFSGSPKAKLDDRGRLKMPAEFKSFLEKKYGPAFNAFYITSREGTDAEIYPMPEWLKYQDRIFNIPKGVPLRKKLMDSNALYGERVDMDPQGRLLMPEELRKAGMVNLDVKVSGEGTLLRVKSLSSLRESVRNNSYDAQDDEASTKYDV
ncbi:MAG TPA: division/cell wall cluster transcriptional repressor MraZ [Terracidiphilus sp.]